MLLLLLLLLSVMVESVIFISGGGGGGGGYAAAFVTFAGHNARYYSNTFATPRSCLLFPGVSVHLSFTLSADIQPSSTLSAKVVSASTTLTMSERFRFVFVLIFHPTKTLLLLLRSDGGHDTGRADGRGAAAEA